MGFCSCRGRSKLSCRGICNKLNNVTCCQQQDPSIIPGLPHELAMCCLARLPRGCRPLARRVSRSWREALTPSTIDDARRRQGITETRVFTCLAYIKDQRKLSSWYMLDPLLFSCKFIPPPTIHSDDEGMDVFSGAMVADGREVLYAGCEGSDVLGFDLSCRQWKPLPFSMNIKCSAFASTRLDDFLYVAGGLDDSLEPLKSAKRMKVETGEWEDIKDMNSVRASCAGVVFQGLFCVIGGFYKVGHNDLEVHNSAEIWDPCTQEWTLAHEMWPLDIFGKMESPMVAVVSDRLYALRAHKLELMWYDHTNKLWKSLGRLPTELCNPDFPYVFGVTQITGLLGVGKELWVTVHCANDIFMLATIPFIEHHLTWRRLPFSFNDFTSIVASVSVTM